MSSFETLPQLLQLAVHSYHNPKCLNDLMYGEWVPVSTEEFLSGVRNLAIAFSEAGLKQGDSLGIYACSSSRWLMVDFAALSIGAITVPIFANISSGGLSHILTDSEMKMIYVEGEEPFESLKNHLKTFSLVIYSDVSVPENHMVELNQFLKTGVAPSEIDPGYYLKLTKKVKPDDLATIIYTSGSTGLPKGVEITHLNLVSQVQGTEQRFDIIAGQDVALSCLPLAHIFERIVGYFYLSQGVSVYFADDVKNLGALLPNVRPTLMTVVPRLLEKLQIAIMSKSNDGGFLKRLVAGMAFGRAQKRSAEYNKNLFDLFYDRFVYSKIRSKFGGRIRFVISGGSALPMNLCNYFWNLGVPVFQGYGMTECSPVVSANCEGANKIGTVGKLYPEVEVKLSEACEILVKGPNVMRGYHNLPEETLQVIDEKGWYHTGDKGEIDSDGYLSITGRIKDLFKSSNGKYVSPIMIEQELTKNNLIDIAFVIGENQKFVSALLFPDFGQMSKLKNSLNMEDMSDEEFIQKSEFLKHIDNAIEEMNRKLNHWENVRKFRVLLETPTVENDGITPTMKLKRHNLLEKYKSLIEEMYRE